ncbi:MAG: efflux RND transporter periplasmic adaptor subunit [Rhodothermales bacterium]
MKRLLPLLLLSLSVTACRDTPVERLLPDPDGSVATPPSLQENPGVATERRLVTLTPQQAQELQTETSVVSAAVIHYDLSIPGEVQAAPEQMAQVSAPIGGRVAALYAHEGESVRPGQVLLELESLEFANLVADYLQAQADETYAQRQVERLTTLVEKKISPEQALDKARADLDRARAATRASSARLLTLGIGSDDIPNLGDRPLLPLRSPLSGRVDRHLIDLGQSVTSYQELMTIVDPTRVLIKGFASPDDAASLRPGDPVVVVPERGGSGQRLDATIGTVNPVVDAESKALVLNILVDLTGPWPLPGQTVRLQVRTQSTMPVISIPTSAVVYNGADAIVYVRVDDLTWERRSIRVERTGQAEVIVAGGLMPGDVIATSQVFSLKALDRYTEYAE